MTDQQTLSFLDDERREQCLKLRHQALPYHAQADAERENDDRRAHFRRKAVALEMRADAVLPYEHWEPL